MSLSERQRALLEACVDVVDSQRFDGYVPVGPQCRTMHSLLVRGLVESAGMMTSEAFGDDRERHAFIPTDLGRALVLALNWPSEGER